MQADSAASRHPWEPDGLKKRPELPTEYEQMLSRLMFESVAHGRPLISRWTRFCWWLSRKLGGRSVFGKRDMTKEDRRG